MKLFLKDLLDWEKDPYLKRVDDYKKLLKILSDTPEEVVRQFPYEQGLNPDFQKLYGNIDLMAITWTKTMISASKLVSAGFNPDFNRVKAASEWDEKEFGNIYSSKEHKLAVEHWDSHDAWLICPVFLENFNSNSLYLVEGHTRLGYLISRYKRGLTTGNLPVYLGRIE